MVVVREEERENARSSKHSEHRRSGFPRLCQYESASTCAAYHRTTSMVELSHPIRRDGDHTCTPKGANTTCLTVEGLQ
jgi:hypothetical protein